jgi:hypothetical protein
MSSSRRAAAPGDQEPGSAAVGPGALKGRSHSLSPARLQAVAGAVRSALKLSSADVPALGPGGGRARRKPAAADSEEPQYHPLGTRKHRQPQGDPLLGLLGARDARPSSGVSRPASAAGGLLSGALVHTLKMLREVPLGGDRGIRTAGVPQPARRSPDSKDSDQPNPQQGEPDGGKEAERARIAWMVELRLPYGHSGLGKRTETCMYGCDPSRGADAVVTHVCRQCKDFLVCVRHAAPCVRAVRFCVSPR